MFAKEGYSNIVVTVFIVFILCLIGISLNGWLATLFFIAAGLLLAFILFFFRDPDRDIPEDPNIILAPADGKIVSINTVEEKLYLNGQAKQISIFLSVLDVHVNRIPLGGKIEYLQYQPGKYLMAWNEKASTLNERADFGVLHPSGVKLFFRQITGFLARRIVYNVKQGDKVKTGHRFGMMKFGSRMDILIPAHIALEVEEGDRTVGGKTILAHINNP